MKIVTYQSDNSPQLCHLGCRQDLAGRRVASDYLPCSYQGRGQYQGSDLVVRTDRQDQGNRGQERRTCSGPGREGSESQAEEGRVITHAFLLELEPGPLPAIVGMDDAASAAWHEISSLRVDSLFEDHAFVIQSLLKKGS